MDMYIFIMFLSIRFLEILPIDTNRPRGRDITKVRVNISIVFSIPSPNLDNKTSKSKVIPLTLIKRNTVKRGYASFRIIIS